MSTMRKSQIFVFLHFQKTGGTTIGRHIEGNFKKDEILYLYPKSKEYFKLGTVEERVGEIKNKLQSLTDEEKEKIKVVYGHLVPWGVEKYLGKKKAYYFTFLRNPIERTVSLFNGIKTKYTLDLKKGIKKHHMHEKNLLINGKVPSFARWLKYKFRGKSGNYLMARYLKELGYTKSLSPRGLVEALNKFNFIGITRNFYEDSLYIYKKMGIKKYYPSLNISAKYIKLDEALEYINDIVKKNEKDLALYAAALTKRRLFVRSKDYKKEVLIKKMEYLLFSGLTRSSSQLKAGIAKILTS